MSAKNVENAEEKKFSLAKQNDVGLVQCTASAETAAVVGLGGCEQAALAVAPERTNASGGSRTTLAPLVLASATTMLIDENDSAGGNKLDIALAVSSTAAGGGLAMSPGSGGGGERADASSEKQGSEGSDKNNSKRKTRRGKTKRGKRSSSSRPYSKSQWKFHVPLVRTAANKRRAKVSLGSTSRGLISTKDPFLLSDQPPLVPYNTNRFLMEDHMPHVLTPSEDEEEFLTKEFSSVYEDARSERLEGLSKSQLIQEYLQLEANYEQVTRRYNAIKSLSIREENESATKDATATAVEGGAAVPPVPVAADRRRLEDRIRELTAENLELRRQLEHASRIGMVLSAKSSPRNYGSNIMVERMDSSSCHGSSSEDSESDSSSSTSSSSSDNDEDNNGGRNNDSSSSSMSDDDDDDEVAQLVGRDDREPLVAMEGPDEMAVPMEPNGFHQRRHRGAEQHQNGLLLADDEEELSCDEDPVSPLSAQSINSPPPPPLVMN